MSDWKTQYGVSDQGAGNAGVHGQPTNWDQIYRAQAETQRLERDLYQKAWQPPSYQPPINTGAYIPLPDNPIKWGRVFLILCVIGLISAWPFLSKLGVPTEEEHLASKMSHYALNEEAVTLSNTASTVLYDKYLKGASTKWGELTPQQQNAVAAAWLRYLQSPYKFTKLSKLHRYYYYDAFESYLNWRESTLSDKEADMDSLNACMSFGRCADIR